MASHQQDHELNTQFKGCCCGAALHSLEEKVENLKLIFEKFIKVQETLNQGLLHALPSNTSPLSHQAESSVSRSLQLCFKGEVPNNTLLTKSNIEDQGALLTVELCDNTGKRVEVSPELCFKDLKVNFSVLDGDFEVGDTDDWTDKDFKNHVASPRKDKPPLLKGNCEVSLNKGSTAVRGISFTDNSSSMRNGSFRLGAQLIKGLSGWVVRPAVSNAFQVKEYRLKSDQKHETPMPEDELYRLKKISKTGEIYRRARQKEVITVMDFLQLYHTDAKELQSILKVAGTKWKETVENAERCILADEHYKYIYHDDDSGDVLVLKCDFKIESVTFKGQTSQPYESLDQSQKDKVVKLRKAAFKKRKELKVNDSVNQTRVQAGPRYPSNVEQQEPGEQEQQQPAPFNMEPNVPYVVNLDQIHSGLSTNLYPGTTAADHVGFQLDVMNASGSLITGNYGVQNTAMGVGDSSSVAYENQTEQVADNGLDSHFTAANQAQMEMQQMLNDPSANLMSSEPFIFSSDIDYDDFFADEFVNELVNLEKFNAQTRRWCKFRVVPLVICRWKRRGAIHCRPQKKQKT